MNELQVFNSKEFGNVRTIEENGKVLFCGSDVAKALGYSNISDALNRHCKYIAKHDIPHPQSQSKTIEMIFISEGDVYRLITHSRLPSAEKFEKWVFDEVLPIIRKTGGYVSDDEMFLNTYLPYADEQTRAMFKSTLETVRGLNKKIEQDKPKVLFADSVASSDSTCLIGEVAKLIKQNGVSIGQNRLFDWLRQNGYLISRKGTDYNMPTQKSMELGLFEIKERTLNNPDGSIRITRTPKVTGKGQQYFINKFLSE